MTAFASNSILILIASVWAYLSIITQSFFPVPVELLIVGLVLAGPEAIKSYKLLKGNL